MLETLLFRIGILLLLALLLGGVWLAVRLWQTRRVSQLASESLPLPNDVVAQLDGAAAAVLAFSTKTCAECRSRQAPALRRLSADLGPAVPIVALDAVEHPDLVARLGILTVPATVVLGAGRQVRHLNLGYANENVLRAQVAGAQA